jgi:hypothetical protein
MTNLYPPASRTSVNKYLCLIIDHLFVFGRCHIIPSVLISSAAIDQLHVRHIVIY